MANSVLNKLKVSQKLLAIFVVVLTTMVLVGVDVISTLNKNKQDGTVINVAGRQRMLTKKFASEVMLYVYEKQKSEHAPLDYDKTVKLYEVSLQALKSGGQTFSDLGMSNAITLIESGATEFKSQLQTSSHYGVRKNPSPTP
ncbi:type IV pili methyl-accepting chemotaxis transducer N-terminal domain-containing protein [Vibrio sonorensis]|uniref:type IV pili methyl-accepting chemotaxis transducer N-terminal domain-containing protein n=1 Tax=Vibrio sonorensis TaxID=1004316 RepID=UPI0008DA3FB8|nr:type IV pili methyl-accepting chemotaxis transducer N-terminal domain-containing protein [Vibrio sonorensis]